MNKYTLAIIFYFLRSIVGIICCTCLAIHFDKWQLIFVSLITYIGFNIKGSEE